MIDVLHVLTKYSDAVGGPEAVYLLPLLLLLEGEDRPQHRRDGGGHGAHTHPQVDYPIHS